MYSKYVQDDRSKKASSSSSTLQQQNVDFLNLIHDDTGHQPKLATVSEEEEERIRQSRSPSISPGPFQQAPELQVEAVSDTLLPEGSEGNRHQQQQHLYGNQNNSDDIFADLLRHQDDVEDKLIQAIEKDDTEGTLKRQQQRQQRRRRQDNNNAAFLSQLTEQGNNDNYHEESWLLSQKSVQNGEAEGSRSISMPSPPTNLHKSLPFIMKQIQKNSSFTEDLKSMDEIELGSSSHHTERVTDSQSPFGSSSEKDLMNSNSSPKAENSRPDFLRRRSSAKLSNKNNLNNNSKNDLPSIVNELCHKRMNDTFLSHLADYVGDHTAIHSSEQLQREQELEQRLLQNNNNAETTQVGDAAALEQTLSSSGLSSSPRRRGGNHRRVLSNKIFNHRRNRTATEALFDFTDQVQELVAEEVEGRQQSKSTQEENLPISSLSSFKPFNYGSSTEPETDFSSSDGGGGDNGRGNEQTDERSNDIEAPLLRGRARRKRLNRRNLCHRYFMWIVSTLDFPHILRSIKDFLLYAVLMIIFPLLFTACVLFYLFDNPEVELLRPAAVSWWLIFIARQLVTLNIARSSAYLIDVITHRTTYCLRFTGPFFTLLLMQASGWPLLLMCWGGWDILLTHGNHPYERNWLWFMPYVKVFSYAGNPDDGILESWIYLRVLLCMMFIGLATSAKRTTVALYLGRRMLQHYRPQLEELLEEMNIIAEVAELAVETELAGFDALVSDVSERLGLGEDSRRGVHCSTGSSAFGVVTGVSGGGYKKKPFGSVLPSTSPKFVEKVPTLSSSTFNKNKDKKKVPQHDDDNSDSDDTDDEDKDDSQLSNSNHAYGENKTEGKSQRKSNAAFSFDKNSAHTLERSQSSDAQSVTSASSLGSKRSVQWNELKNKAQLENKERLKNSTSPSSAPIESIASPDLSSRLQQMRERGRRQNKSASLSIGSFVKIMANLDEWQEPEAQAMEKDNASIYDILQFRKAMAFMQNIYPFSSAFGSARTRKACIKSSMRVYKRLLKYVPTEAILPFDVIGSLAYDENNNNNNEDGGTIIESKARALLRVFLPNKDDKLSEMAFVQSCDGVYKKLCFLRASLSNSSKIDSVLEDMFNVLFYVVLGIISMSILGLNPWPLLVSFSTLTVSFAFAFGPSAAKYIEGILLISLRRPYDIGDRITISKPDEVLKPIGPNSWLVQDITLTATTLRCAQTNEVCTVNNSSIASSRIVNCARSPKAITTIRIRFRIDATHSDIDSFRSRVEVYLKDRPRTWAGGLIHFRNNEVNYDQRYVEYWLVAQHVKSWQELPHIMVQKGELDRKCNEFAKKLNIAYSSPALNITMNNMSKEDMSDFDLKKRK